MAPAKTPHNTRGRKRDQNELHLEALGDKGRVTGIEMPRFSRDDNQYESLSDYWPTTGKGQRVLRKSEMASSSSEEMDVQDSSGPDVIQTLQQRSAKSAHKLPPHARSPIKTGLGSPPKRPSSVGAPSSAQTPRTERPSSSHGTNSVPKLDLTIGHSPRRPYTPHVNSSIQKSRNVYSISPSPEKGRRVTEPPPLHVGDDDDDDDADDTTGQMDGFSDDLDEEEPAQPGYENDTLRDLRPNEIVVDPQLVAEEEEDSSYGKGKNKKPRGRPRTSDVSPPSQQLTNGHVEEEAELELEPAEFEQLDVDDPDEAEDSSVEEPTASPGKRGASEKAGQEEPNSKRTRRNPAKEKAKTAEMTTNRKRGRPPGSKTTLSQKDSNAKMKPPNRVARPGPPGIPRSNVRARQGTPFEDDGDVIYTRSGRVSFKPLQHWKNERVVFKPIENQDGQVVHSVDNIIRMEDVTPQKRVRKTSQNPPRRRRRRPGPSIFDDGSSDSEDQQEDWEATEGVVSGAVRVWDPELEQGLEDERRDQELAFAASKIEARDNAEGSFRFAKTLTMPFFGSGIVELPPGGIKRSKNSRRMQMMFFVHFGKVTVDIAGTRFVISKGGVWQVPRGNNYSIRNETDHPAKLFFAQGCEVDLSANLGRGQGSGEPAVLPPE